MQGADAQVFLFCQFCGKGCWSTDEKVCLIHMAFYHILLSYSSVKNGPRSSNNLITFEKIHYTDCANVVGYIILNNIIHRLF